ncbi:hypothetical protein P691DRAFT_786535 [Macrolepiota fuliginosa MF-IS2]|uniref:Uncharacterized protein n=1 Tax=Macrolepiota fuliginosa MF-IS2 TaxID=1400762 RepID=A0A9P6C0F0_9AGAR|nr:hypothetical protein P691DRAFT_786535 [Macrolepiota fuliginosa MF-IS2]
MELGFIELIISQGSDTRYRIMLVSDKRNLQDLLRREVGSQFPRRTAHRPRQLKGSTSLPDDTLTSAVQSIFSCDPREFQFALRGSHGSPKRLGTSGQTDYDEMLRNWDIGISRPQDGISQHLQNVQRFLHTSQSRLGNVIESLQSTWCCSLINYLLNADIDQMRTSPPPVQGPSQRSLNLGIDEPEFMVVTEAM